jgi:molybdopterin-guanine dinucleotide biosynthesis protein A
MIGAVLCGGLSLRMGNDKGLLVSVTPKKTWAEIVKEELMQIPVSTVLSINPQQNENYLKYFTKDELVLDNPIINTKGPLLGVLSVHLKYPDQDLMVVACDMINMNEAVLMNLFSSYSSSRTEAIAFKGEQIEPLCAIYSSRGLVKIFTACQANQLEKNSMMHVLEQLDASYVPIREEWKSSFKNLNTVRDIN